jgi:general stress protein YciG
MKFLSKHHREKGYIMETTKARRGFAAMSPEKRREIARKGGASVPADKRSFSRSPELAATAGSKGGSAPKKVSA